MTDEIRPAMTQEQWADELPPHATLRPDDEDRAESHRIAALHLYGQPFGFTQEDLQMCEDQVT